MSKIVIDFETTSNCDLKQCGSRRYAEDPTTEILCLSFEGIGSLETWVPGGSTEHLLDLVQGDSIFVAHNAGFEKDIWRCIMVPRYGFPDIPNDRWEDTLAVCAMKNLPLDLDGAARVLHLATSKDLDGRRLVIGLSRFNKKGYLPEVTPQVLSRAAAYCEDDVAAERSVSDRVGSLTPEEREVWLLDQRINERGVGVDLDYVRACRKIVAEASAPLAAEFTGLTGLKVTQTIKIKGWANSLGARLPDLTKDTLAEMLGRDEDGQVAGRDDYTPLPDEVHRALSIRQLIGSASIKKLGRMEDAAVGGRLYRLLQYHGAGPGRWAGRIVQPQNFPRGSLKLGGEPTPVDVVVSSLMTGDWQYVEATLGPAVESVLSGLRHALIPADGCAFISGDFSQIEARITLALAGQWDKVEILKNGGDIYIDMAEKIFRRPISKKNDPEERTAGKSAVLGLGFQMGAPRFHREYAQNRGLDFCKEIVRVYREDWAPKVPELWNGLNQAALYTVWDGTPHEAYGVTYALEDGWMTARLPSGRKLWYFNPQKATKAMPWDEDDVRKTWTYQANKTGKWTTIYAFGGLLTENVAQALARDLLVAAMFKAESNGFPVVLTVHDEVVSEPLEKDVDEVAFQQLMCDSPAWAAKLGIPVATETWAGNRYRK